MPENFPKSRIQCVFFTVDSPYSRARKDSARNYRESCDYAESPYYGLNRRERNSIMTKDPRTSALAHEVQNREPESLSI